MPLYRNNPSSQAATATIATSETTTSATMADLTTPGPAVTLNVGGSGKALVVVSAYSFNSGANESYVGFAVSGASTVAAAIETGSTVNGGATAQNFSYTKLLTGLTPGSNTFTAKYAASAGTATFRTRLITVIPL